MEIANAVIGPSYPGAFPEFWKILKELGTADRALFPMELLRESERVRQGAFLALSQFLNLHTHVERVWILVREGFKALGYQMRSFLMDMALQKCIRAEVTVLVVSWKRVAPRSIVTACGDGRPWFVEKFGRIPNTFPDPLILSVPGEEQWLADNPEIAMEIEAYFDTTYGNLPRYVLKHGGPHGSPYSGCGYRREKRRVADMPLLMSPNDEWGAACLECTTPGTSYQYVPGFGNVHFLPLGNGEPCPEELGEGRAILAP